MPEYYSHQGLHDDTISHQTLTHPSHKYTQAHARTNSIHTYRQFRVVNESACLGVDISHLSPPGLGI